MNINRGDHVVHPRFGVGTVVSIEVRHFSEAAPRLFYRVDFDNTTLWIPVPIPETGGLRPVTPKSDLSHYRQLLKSSPVPLDNDFRLRKITLDERLKAGTFQSLCEVVRDLLRGDLGLLQADRVFSLQFDSGHLPDPKLP